MPHKDVPPPLELVKERIEEVLPPDARERIEGGDAVVIDTRDADRFEQGRLAGAISLPSGESAREAHSEQYAKAVEEAAAGRDRPLVLYCGEGNRSARTADALLNEHGFENVVSIIGGLKLWDDVGYPVEGELAAGADEAEVSMRGLDDDGDTS
jgi:sulfur-carrier protein adenylyltransferase/sulfurtransferase